MIYMPGFWTPASPAWQRILKLAEDDGWRWCYDFNNPNTWTLASGAYSALADGLGNGTTLAQGTTAWRPGQVELDGMFWGSFDGGDDNIFHEVGTFGHPHTLVVVGLSNNTGEDIGNFTDAGVQHAANRHIVGATLSSEWRLFGGATIQTAANDHDTDLHVFSGVLNGASSSLRIDSSEVVSGNAGSNSMGGFKLGCGHSSGGPNAQFLLGRIGVVLSYDGALTGSNDELSRMEDLLGSIYL